MARSTTVVIRNDATFPIRFESVENRHGEFVGSVPDGDLRPGSIATFRHEASHRFGSVTGVVSYVGYGDRLRFEWDNPLVGRNSYRMAIDAAQPGHPRLGVVCDGHDDDAETTVTFSVCPPRKRAVRGFKPSTSGFAFRNSWPGDPLRRVDLPVGSIPIGKASNGLCGGMAYAARDFFEAGVPVPTTTRVPADRSALREFIIDRLIDSFDLPGGVAPYATLMSSRYPAADDDLLAIIGAVPSRAAVLARRTWPEVKRSIDSGHPCPLGLVMVESDDLGDLKRHHQVLAYAYRVAGTKLTIWVYDPNRPLDDRVTIEFDTGRTDRPVDVTHQVKISGPLICAFVPRYEPVHPPDGSRRRQRNVGPGAVASRRA